MITLRHLGMSGLAIAVDGAEVLCDPPTPGPEPAILTWSETDRVAGARGRSLAADPRVLAWLGASGLGLIPDHPVPFAGFELQASAYIPIPYATAPEALRKLRSALRSPRFALDRVWRTLGRPDAPPLVVELRRGPLRVVHAGQSLHRFLSAAALDLLVSRHGRPDVLIAGTDYDDEVATGRAMGAFDARHTVLIDSIGPVRRRLGLPVRPLRVCLDAAPPHTHALPEGGRLELR